MTAGLNIQLDQGRIVVMHPRQAVKGFTDAAEAVAYVGYHVADKSLPVEFAPSCLSPKEHGVPGFTVEGFREAVHDEIYRIQASTRSMAA